MSAAKTPQSQGRKTADAAQKPQAGGLVSDTIGKITKRIRDEELGPGDKLMSESALSKELGVSRTVIREAYRSLSAMRILDLSAGRAATVSRLDHEAMSLMIEHGIGTEQISYSHIFDVRRTIESRTVNLAALRRTDEEAEAILHHAKSMRSNDIKEIQEHDLSFHLTIAQASRNPIFLLIVGAFQDVSRQIWATGWRSRETEEEREFIIQTHIDLACAIRDNDTAEAARLTDQHFENGIKALLASGYA